MSVLLLPDCRAHFIASCFDKYGRLKWEDEADNLVTTAGKNMIGDVVLRGGTQLTTWYMGVKGTGTPNAADTAASHASWTEITAYDESARRTVTLPAFAAGSSNNSGAKCVFTFNAAVTVAGFFTISNSTKGGTSGTLLNVADFSTARSAADDDTISVAVSFTL